MALQDFTTFTEVDPGSKLTVTATKVTCTNQARSENNYVYKDFGPSFFGQTKALSVDFTISHGVGSTNDSSFVGVSFTNTLGAPPNGQGAVDYWMAYTYYAVSGSFMYFTFTEIVGGGSGGNQGWQLTGLPATYYTTLSYNPTLGSYGTVTWKFYSDAGRTVLVQTLTITLTKRMSFRYIQVMAPYFDGSSPTSNGYVENMTITGGGVSRPLPTFFRQ